MKWHGNFISYRRLIRTGLSTGLKMQRSRLGKQALSYIIKNLQLIQGLRQSIYYQGRLSKPTTLKPNAPSLYKLLFQFKSASIY